MAGTKGKESIVRFSLLEASRQSGVDRKTIVYCLQERWLVPAYPEEAELDEADVARLRLIATLREDFGVNDEAIPVILHLVDQLRRIPV